MYIAVQNIPRNPVVRAPTVASAIVAGRIEELMFKDVDDQGMLGQVLMNQLQNIRGYY